VTQRSVGALAGIAGVALIGVSFAINGAPPEGASPDALVRFAQQHRGSILWGAWLQAVGPALLVLFAGAVVHAAGAARRLTGWMTLFGAATLMLVSLLEVVFYMTALSDAAPNINTVQISARTIS